MKKLLLFTIVLICAHSVFAQKTSFEPRVKFSYEFGLNKYKPDAITGQVAFGMRSSEQTWLAIGVETSKMVGIFKRLGSFWYDESQDDGKSISVLLAANHDLIAKGVVRPYLEGDVGFLFVKDKDPEFSNKDENYSGFFLRPELGVNFRLKRHTISLGCGFKFFKLFSFEEDGWFIQVSPSLAYRFRF